MNGEDSYAIWAPEGSEWSAWAKPILFTAFPATRDLPPDVPQELPWAPSGAEATAVILDLDGAASVATGLALAARGYRPVPLFNGCAGSSAVVEVDPIVRALDAGTDVLRPLRIRDDAVPVFLLDARRSSGESRPGRFDNRWHVLPQDLPSGTRIMSRGIGSALLVQRGRTDPQEDLAHVLRRWQEAGVSIASVDIATDARPRPLRVERPRGFGSLFRIAMVVLGLRRGSAGGFGSLIPVPPPPSKGGGGGFHKG